MMNVSERALLRGIISFYVPAREWERIEMLPLQNPTKVQLILKARELLARAPNP